MKTSRKQRREKLKLEKLNRLLKDQSLDRFQDSVDPNDQSSDPEQVEEYETVLHKFDLTWTKPNLLKRIESFKRQIKNSDFFIQFNSTLLPTLVSHCPKTIYCLGLGSLSSTNATVSQLQLAFFLLLLDSLNPIAISENTKCLRENLNKEFHAKNNNSLNLPSQPLNSESKNTPEYTENYILPESISGNSVLKTSPTVLAFDPVFSDLDCLRFFFVFYASL
ncbi:hypothetical protein BB560_000090 [Smittium megazygosporum]|uniref:SRR1-like domain-containing protein n=1 Tax=Smittium megazygosporum TaxID=133381 RepID=A0A2T9ZLF2_9FUNG|nr:hypothetical protein BB560_000090 [Smittium megazygosporum]